MALYQAKDYKFPHIAQGSRVCYPFNMRKSSKALVSLLISVLLFATSFAFASKTNAASQSTKSYTILMPKPYKPAGINGGTDDYHCFLIDPKVKEDLILTSIQFVPQNKPLVHHAILFRIPANQVASTKQLDSNGQGWSCFGGSGVGTMFQSFLTTPWLSAWVPGRNTDNAPNGYGYPFNKGDQIVLQVHYNLLAASADKTTNDRSKIILKATPQNGSTVKQLGYELFPAPVELACPSGVTGPLCDRKQSLMDLAARTSPAAALEATGIALLCKQSPFNPTPSITSTCDRQITKPQTVIAAAPHMHLLGRSLKIIANPGTANETILLDRQNYNFDDQSSTVLAKPVKLNVGDTVRVECTFDPTLRQKLPLLKNLPAKYITWGEGSSDEMCLGVLISDSQS